MTSPIIMLTSSPADSRFPISMVYSSLLNTASVSSSPILNLRILSSSGFSEFLITVPSRSLTTNFICVPSGSTSAFTRFSENGMDVTSIAAVIIHAMYFFALIVLSSFLFVCVINYYQSHFVISLKEVTECYI